MYKSSTLYALQILQSLTGGTMKSIQTKLIMLILCCVLLATALVGSVAILDSERVIDEDSANIMNLTCSEKAAEINALLNSVEQSVGTLAFYTKTEITSAERLQNDPAYLADLTMRIEKVAANIASSTYGAVAVYLRFDPNLTYPTAGFFSYKENVNGAFKALPPTDLSAYSSSDDNYVGWYHLPLKKGFPTWIPPYVNRNININMISYVVPIYIDSRIIGVVGMDINFDLLTKSVSNIKVYESGYAFLIDNYGHIMYHKTLPYNTGIFELEHLGALRSSLAYGSSHNTLIKYPWDGQWLSAAYTMVCAWGSLLPPPRLTVLKTILLSES